jgi:hypothetical protein
VWWVLGNMRSHDEHPAGLLDMKVRPRPTGDDDAPLAVGRREKLPSRVGADGSADEPADGEDADAPDAIELREPTPATAPHDGHRAAGTNAESTSSLDGLFNVAGADGENAIDVPDLALFDDPPTPPSERPAPPRERPAQSDELTRALFDHD